MRFQIDYQQHSLQADCIGVANVSELLLLHGAGVSDKQRFRTLRERLAQGGIGSRALDFIGHGETGGQLGDSSLARRTAQALTLAHSSDHRLPLAVLGTSMGAYNAIKLTESIDIDVLILLVPAIYTAAAYNVAFGPEFSTIIRQERSWLASDAWQILANFTGSLLVVAAENDRVIPSEIPPKLVACAVRAQRRELVTLAGSSHMILQHLTDNTADFERVVAKILGIVPN